MKVKNVALVVFSMVAANIFTGCTPVSTLTGDKLVKQAQSNLIVQSNVDMTDVNVNTLIPGKVKEIKVKEGDNVKKRRCFAYS